MELGLDKEKTFQCALTKQMLEKSVFPHGFSYYVCFVLEKNKNGFFCCEGNTFFPFSNV